MQISMVFVAVVAGSLVVSPSTVAAASYLTEYSNAVANLPGHFVAAAFV